MLTSSGRPSALLKPNPQVGEKMATTSQGTQKSEEQDEDLWSAILNDVASSSSRNRPQVTKTLLVLGDINSGKSTLVDRLCQVSQSHPLGGKYPLSGCSLEYRFIDVQDEETDDLLDRMGVWILDGVVWHKDLLPFVLTKSSIDHTTVMIVTDMSQPWSVMDSLDRWAEVLSKHIDGLKIPEKEMKDMRERMVKRFQSYVDPEEPTVAVGEEDGVALPLGESTLTSNLGVPIIVVCCKSDSVTELEKTHGYREEHFDYIQQAIRKFCLNYGAALFYTSTKEDKNLQILHKYLLHRCYDLPFKEAAWVIDKDSIFIPSGWDNEKKINILQEHIKGLNSSDPYENVIMAPKQSQPDMEVGLVTAEADQVFLMAQQALMVKTPRSASTTPQGAAAKDPKAASSPRAQGTTPEADSKANGETVLANFFNSLLSSKKQPGAKGARATSRNEAAAEIERLQATKKS